MKSKKLRILIVTVTRNDPEGLNRTLKSITSVKGLHYSSILLKDGSNNDQNEKILSKYTNLPIQKIDERDISIFNAMNICIDYSIRNLIEYDYCVFMNSGDEFICGEETLSVIEGLQDVDLIIGASNVMFPDGGGAQYPSIKKVKSDSDYLKWLSDYNPVHQSVWFSSRIFSKYACKYDEDFKIQADTKLIISMMRKVVYKYIPHELSNFYADGYSSNYKSSDKVVRQAVEQFFIERNLKGLPLFKCIKSTLKFYLKFLLWKFGSESLARKVHHLYIKILK